jgi:hypothetical protein
MIKLVDQFKGSPQFVVFENPRDPKDFITVQLSVRITGDEAEDLGRLIDLAMRPPLTRPERADVEFGRTCREIRAALPFPFNALTLILANVVFELDACWWMRSQRRKAKR